MLCRIYILLLSLCFTFIAKATHVVGGDFYYKYLGNDKYQITMVMFVDCENGNPQAINSDKIATFGVFDGLSSNFLNDFTMTRTGPVKVNSANYKCIKPPSSVCVDQYVYQTTRTFPKRRGGYIISYQRCCRNNSINNIDDPGGTGATFWIKLADSDLQIDSNSSPRFKNLPPNYVCIDAQLKFLHDAVDDDGDSLVYEFYQPYKGASKDDPMPSQPSNPPYNTVDWLSTFNNDYQITSNPKIEIDSKTGEILGVPTKLGQYVIGIKVKEFRNGKLIGETLRDFQINVIKCQFDIIPKFIFGDSSGVTRNIGQIYACSDTVFFKDQSFAAKQYFWNFGDPTTTKDTTSMVNPKWVYPGPGDYTVILKVKNTICEAQYQLKVKIRTKKSVDLGPDQIFCNKVSKWLYVKNSDFTNILWNGISGNASYFVTKPGRYVVNVSYSNCKYTDTAWMFLDSVRAKVNPKDSLFCDKVDAIVTASDFYPGSKLKWSTGRYDTLPQKRITAKGLTFLTTTSKFGCVRIDTVNFTTADLNPNLGPDKFICNEVNLNLNPNDPKAKSYLWNEGSNSSTLPINNPGKYWVTVFNKHCFKSDTIVITNSQVDLDLGVNRHFCDQVSILLDAGKGKDEMATSFEWSDASIKQTLMVNNPGLYWVKKTDGLGCFKIDSIYITLSNSPIISLGNDTGICIREKITLKAKGGFKTYIWYNGESDSIHTSETEGKKYLTVIDKLGCKGSDTMLVKFDINALPNQLFIGNIFTPNNDQLNEVFPFEIQNLPPQYQFKVFNRWGQKLFESSDEKQFWDGTYLGKPVAIDTYIWLMSYRACNGLIKSQKGTVIVSK